ncbi:MAG: hypothetical protein LBR08_09665, partial [Bacteroidales bacterium]|nr:hypothetical protein [Bacteroidales bacterium]
RFACGSLVRGYRKDNSYGVLRHRRRLPAQPTPQGVALLITPYKRASGEAQCGVAMMGFLSYTQGTQYLFQAGFPLFKELNIYFRRAFLYSRNSIFISGGLSFIQGTQYLFQAGFPLFKKSNLYFRS